MNYRTLTKKLGRLGCEFTRQGPGSHEIWWNPAQGKFSTIPWRPGHEDLPRGTSNRSRFTVIGSQLKKQRAKESHGILY